MPCTSLRATRSFLAACRSGHTDQCRDKDSYALPVPTPRAAGVYVAAHHHHPATRADAAQWWHPAIPSQNGCLRLASRVRSQNLKPPGHLPYRSKNSPTSSASAHGGERVERASPPPVLVPHHRKWNAAARQRPKGGDPEHYRHHRCCLLVSMKRSRSCLSYNTRLPTRTSGT